MQFLMGLNDVYEYVHNQVLSMGPLLNVTKDFYLICQVGKQKQVLGLLEVSSNNLNAAFVVKSAQKALAFNEKERKGRLCPTHCKKTEHTIDRCFNLMGFLEWFQGGNSNRGNARVTAAI